MTFLSDGALAHLQSVVDLPDLAGTRYELGARLGQGGMGTVYRARDGELGRDVALKVVHHATSSADLRDRLTREARTLARLEHPGIVPVHDVGALSDGRVFYTMKLVRGTRLDERLRQAGAPLSELVRILERVCEAVAFAHARGVIHRDLKPQNIMVGEFGEVLVMDWGIAKVLADPPEGGGDAGPRASDESTTAHGTVLGTPGYMAPEQATGDARSTDARSDVYAIGALLRDVIAAGTPPSGAWSGTRARQLQAIVARAMAAEPSHRYASVSALVSDLAAWLAGEPVSASPEGALDRLARVAWKYRTAILLVLAYLVMRVVLLLVTGR